MTAEVAILNREAVALAADSAVTLTSLDTSKPHTSKIYNTANKLFALSSHEPVAVMIYGNVAFGTIPWTTIIKEYNRKLGSKTFRTIDKYASHFFAYILSATNHLSGQALQQQVEIKAQWELDELRRVVKPPLTDSTLTKREIQNHLIYHTEKRITSLRSESVKYISQKEAEKIINSMSNWPTMLDKSLSELPVNNRILNNVKTMVNASLRSISSSPLQSGIVVAGFGAKECYPAISHRLVDGVIMGKVPTRLVERIQIDDSLPYAILGFAQNDMVTNFMSGIHPTFDSEFENHYSDIKQIYDGAVRYLIRHLQRRFNLPLSEKNIFQLEYQMAQIWAYGTKELRNPIDSFYEHHHNQIMSMVQWMPQEDLAEMAENLVNLTSFKRQVTPDDNTVGGPVDVAVITKGDGFGWIKHKNLYHKEINP